MDSFNVGALVQTEDGLKVRGISPKLVRPSRSTGLPVGGFVVVEEVVKDTQPKDPYHGFMEVRCRPLLPAELSPRLTSPKNALRVDIRALLGLYRDEDEWMAPRFSTEYYIHAIEPDGEGDLFADVSARYGMRYQDDHDDFTMLFVRAAMWGDWQPQRQRIRIYRPADTGFTLHPVTPKSCSYLDVPREGHLPSKAALDTYTFGLHSTYKPKSFGYNVPWWRSEIGILCQAAPKVAARADEYRIRF